MQNDEMEKAVARGLPVQLSHGVTPKYRFRILQGALAKYVEERMRAICEWKDCGIEELAVMADHVHLVVNVPPRVSISDLMGFSRARQQSEYSNTSEPEAKHTGKPFLEPRLLRDDDRVGRREIRRYVRYQEEAERLEENEREEAGLF